MEALYTIASRLTSSRPNLTRATSTDSISSHITNDDSSNAQSSSSTPPTSAADTASVSSQSIKLDEVSPAQEDHDHETEGAMSRPRRARTTTYGSYNVKVLAGTSQHAPRKYQKAAESSGSPPARRRTISGDTLVGGSVEHSTTFLVASESSANSLVQEGIDALKMDWSVPELHKSRSMMSLMRSPKKEKKHLESSRRISTRSTGIQPIDLAHTLSGLGKRARNKFEEGIVKGKRELKRLADTAEFAKIEQQPIVHTVWSNGKFVAPGESGPPPRKRAKVEPPAQKLAPEPRPKEEENIELKKPVPRGPKKWAVKGLYAGQDGEEYWKLNPKQRNVGDKPNGALPLPVYSGDRLISRGRNFKLPFDICNPLTERQPKPDEWRKMPKNRFVGEAAAAWKKSTLFDDFSSRCICKTENGCDDSCQNRIMLYECDAGNCVFGHEADSCHNRAFAALQARKVKGGKFNVGVEVIKTVDKGYGVRTNRCFNANQIITEYTGEIITEDECDRRMNEVYKNNVCYYLMSFDQNTILDATEKGSIARFVNHSCDPNCRMVKWVVGGRPRMALFAGDRDIMTGEELTYDYNFDPFSAKNVQECRCGSDNCRGILGPRPKDQKFSKPGTIISGVKSAIGKGKRKLQELLGGEADNHAVKKRKIAAPKGSKRSMSTKALDAVVGVKRSLSKTMSSASRKNAAMSKQHVVKRTYKKRVGLEKRQAVPSSRNSSLTMVATNESKAVHEKKKPGPKPGYKYIKKRKSATPAKIRKSSYVKKGGWGGTRYKGVKMQDVKNGVVVIEKGEKGKSIVKSMKSRLGQDASGASGSTIKIVTTAEERQPLDV